MGVVTADRELVERCLTERPDGDPPAFRQLYERHGPEVYRLLLRLLGERPAAEDALQETFLRLHRGLRGFDLGRPLRPYVLGIARHVAVETLRRRHRKEAPMGKLDPTSAGALVPERVARDERARLVHEALAALDPEHRSVLVLRHAHGLSQGQVAEALECTERTVRNRLRAAATLFERELRRRGVLGEEAR